MDQYESSLQGFLCVFLNEECILCKEMGRVTIHIFIVAFASVLSHFIFALCLGFSPMQTTVCVGTGIAAVAPYLILCNGALWMRSSGS